AVHGLSARISPGQNLRGRRATLSRDRADLARAEFVAISAGLFHLRSRYVRKDRVPHDRPALFLVAALVAEAAARRAAPLTRLHRARRDAFARHLLRRLGLDA